MAFLRFSVLTIDDLVVNVKFVLFQVFPQLVGKSGGLTTEYQVHYGDAFDDLYRLCDSYWANIFFQVLRSGD